MRVIKPNHPTYEKISRLMSLCSELGISISVGSNHSFDIFDAEHGEFGMLDVEGSRYPIDTFPPEMDYHIVKKDSEE